MKFLIVFTALFALVLARPDVDILKQDSDIQADSYKFIVETSDGKLHEEEGHLKDADTDHSAIVVTGSFKWKDDKTGEVFSISYTADENGFQPKGDHIPQVPEIQ